MTSLKSDKKIKMTVYNRTEKNTRTLITSSSTMSEVRDDLQSTTTNEIQPPPSTPELVGPLVDCCVGGDVISPSQILTDFDPRMNIPPPRDFGTFDRCYLGDWSGVENLFQLPIIPHVEQIWPPAPTPPPPMAFGINNDIITEDEYEQENVQELVNALDNIILTQPHTTCEPKVVGLPYVDVDIYTLHPILPAPLNMGAWIPNDVTDGHF